MNEKLYPGFWNGEPAKFRVVNIIIGPEPEELKAQIEKNMKRKRFLWFVPFIGQEREAVEVCSWQKFYIDNKDGSGVKKVVEGKGSPRYGHRSIYPAQVLNEIPKENWSRHWPALTDRIEEEIDIAWRKIDPEGYNQMKEETEALRQTIMKMRK